MASKTLTAFMKHWTAEFPPDKNPVELPFNIEKVCLEIDQALREAEARGMERAAKLCERVTWQHSSVFDETVLAKSEWLSEKCAQAIRETAKDDKV